MSRRTIVLLFCLLQTVYVSNEFIREESFYEAVKVYYSGKPANADTVVGNEVLSVKDLVRSREFLRGVLSWRGGGAGGARPPPGTARALDCGAGYGRVALQVLVHFFDKIDLVEQNEQFAELAVQLIRQNHTQKLGTMYKMKAQHFHPKTYYDVIWIQWLLMYLTDEDAISLLERCRLALKPNGVIILKENASPEAVGPTFEAEEASILRSSSGLVALVEAAGLRVVRARLEADGAPHEQEYEDVLVLALAPRSSASATTNATRDDGDRCFY